MANEKRLIDAYKLEDLVRSNSARYHHVDDVIAAIAGQPTVDAVEVVRCGQCKDSDYSKTVSCAYICRNEKSPCYYRVTYADFGCLYGERSEGE